jgi:hypothetical protein
MRNLLKRRPSPSLVVAVIALIVACTGTAVAGVATISSLSKNDKKKVRNIADQEIDAKAPGLSVKSAGDATNQLWAVVKADASQTRATPGIISVTRDTTSDGKYIVTTDRDLSNCFYVASLGGTEPGVGVRGDISVNPIASSNKSLYVLTSSEGAGQNADRAFTLLIRC